LIQFCRHDDLKEMLDSSDDRKKLEAMKRIVGVRVTPDCQNISISTTASCYAECSQHRVDLPLKQIEVSAIECYLLYVESYDFFEIVHVIISYIC